MSQHAPALAARVFPVDTPQGPGRLHVSASEHPVMALVLGHGAGGGLDGADLVALARHLPALGITVVRYEQPWKVSGRRVAVRPALLDQAWLPAVSAVRASGTREGLPGQLPGCRPGLPLAVGGHSAGARVACRTASEVDAVAVLTLSFPLHPPGHPEKSRLEELLGVRQPVLCLQGTRDPFGGADELRACIGAGGPRVREVPGAAHDLRLRPSDGVDADAWWQQAARDVGEWLLRRANGQQSPAVGATPAG